MCGFLIAFPVFLLTNDVDLTKNVKFSVRILDVFAGLVIASAIITGWFQYTNNKRELDGCVGRLYVLNKCSIIMTLNIILQRSSWRVSKKNYPDISMGITESTLLDPEGQKWGKYRGWQLYFLQHIGALVLATMASFIMLYFLV